MSQHDFRAYVFSCQQFTIFVFLLVCDDVGCVLKKTHQMLVKVGRTFRQQLIRLDKQTFAHYKNRVHENMKVFFIAALYLLTSS